jgi:sugar/nucleoside kinase (ribokinase family)
MDKRAPDPRELNMSERLDAVVAGHICLDMTPSFPSAGGARLADWLRPGVLQHVGPLTVSTGGAVPNTGLPLGRMGSNVALMGKCGSDELGRTILGILQAEAPGSEAGMQIVEGEETSYTVVLAPPGIDRVFLHNPGANDTFCAADVDFDRVSQARLFHFGYSSLMARMYRDQGRELTEIFRRARQAGCVTSLDTSCPPVESEAAGADWHGIFSRTLPDVDLFLPSAEELLLLLDRGRYLQLVDRADGGELLELITPEILTELGRTCIDYGAAVVLIKCGHLGIYARTAGSERLGRCRDADIEAWADQELLVPSFQVEKVVSATGAGDCAIAGFLTGWLRDAPPAEALGLACAAGAQNVATADSISGILPWDRTRKWLASRPAQREIDPSWLGGGWRWDREARVYRGSGGG